MTDTDRTRPAPVQRRPGPAAPLNADDRPPAELRPGEWLSAHVYYAGDRDPLLGECAGPLFERLRGEGLADCCYFLRHWLEGPHVRLRMRPTSTDAIPALTAAVEEAVGGFLRSHPSVYDPAIDLSDEQYRERFRLEFSDAQWEARYGPGTVRMPRRPNDSLAYLGYEPELERYGGPIGVALAEWHADRSSSLVASLLSSANTQVGSVRLGLAAQLTATLALTVLDDTERTVAFFTRRMADWEPLFKDRYDTYAAAYQRMAGPMGDKVEALHTGVLGGQPELLTGFLRRWAEHGTELRTRIDEEAARGALVFPSGDGTGTPVPVDAETARTALLAGLTHMGCNRLGVTVGNEDYLAYLLRRALRERVQGLPADR
ncbi:lantibiotic dehydratase C-terminal domain-containing protein [Streptomyces sp. CA-250714]|uniref:lantibiotic dehydratase C-terminal domain-containing protein n=1 Tax=Streptomyces sp. CA-250714 TaxID=3240060 RepID=UPI003D8EB27D